MIIQQYKQNTAYAVCVNLSIVKLYMQLTMNKYNVLCISNAIFQTAV